MTLKTLALIICSLIILAVLVVPSPGVVVPEWHVRVIDSHHRPLAGIIVRQDWKDYFVEPANSTHIESETTDDNGDVTFPERRVYSPLILRALAMVLARADFITHQSYGPHASVYAEDHYATIFYTGVGSLPTEIVLTD